MAKRLIVNADDFGISAGVNRGILECHDRGVVTSASLVVTGRVAAEAAAAARERPGLSLGLHWVGDGEYGPAVDTEDPEAVRAEVERQLELFESLTGSAPTHADSHHHLHRNEGVEPVFAVVFEPLGIPVRGDGTVAHIGGFYAQWEWKVTNLEYVSLRFLERILREEVGEGVTELACHPGYLDDELDSDYREEREAELRTLTDPRLPEVMRELGIELVSYGRLHPR
jgi:predicted glycoside hydrolase/deacetylase ChbG (UPF0249 family)